ncbi:hypothetical protein JZ751_015734 [Albula glossodonta]|uniref:AP-4 complex accessory subunit Tepsin VHS/ENTH-like domain-containing protein n=1 Tax=Albula glossodonta TaxID=121402 RepID=A0A8T2N2U6_9TELE|nr:hypothetical protein JZ751_015734 [Albula glossodonta]
MATLLDRLAFLQKIPTLMKATADDETPCPGYLFEEIGKISHESMGCSQCLLEYLLDRLQTDSCHVKLKCTVAHLIPYMAAACIRKFELQLRIQKAAEVVASAVLPPTEHQGIRLHDNHYRAVVAPSAVVEVAVPACSYTLPTHGLKATQRSPGQAGGGWEESDSGHSSHDSSQENGHASQASATDSQVDAMHLGDCCQESMLISSLTEGSKVFLSREETQHLLKECGRLNCEAVVELLCRKLQDPTHNVQMRALCAVACLMSSDLLSLDHIFGVTHKPLLHLSEGPPGPAANKATKLLRQFEALMTSQGAVVLQGAAGPPAGTAPSLLEDSTQLARGPLPPISMQQDPEPRPSYSAPAVTVETQALCHGNPRRDMDTLSLFSGMELVRAKPVCASVVPTMPALTDKETVPAACNSDFSHQRVLCPQIPPNLPHRNDADNLDLPIPEPPPTTHPTSNMEALSTAGVSSTLCLRSRDTAAFCLRSTDTAAFCLRSTDTVAFCLRIRTLRHSACAVRTLQHCIRLRSTDTVAFCLRSTDTAALHQAAQYGHCGTASGMLHQQ